MILIKKSTDYTIESSNSEMVLTADLHTSVGTILLDGLILSTDGNHIGRFSYQYIKDGESSKTVSRIRRNLISSVDILLEDTMSYLILRFNMS